jgi:Protein of unknown function (DUF4235)
MSKPAAVLYKPLGLVASVGGGLLAGAVFKQLWKLITGEDEAPQATDRERGWREVVLAAAVQGATFGAVKALVDRGGATGWRRLTGTWPGDEPKQAEADR